MAAAVFFSWKAYQIWQVNRALQEFTKKHQVDIKLARDIARAESSLDPGAEGHDGGLGLYQFMPKTWSWATEKLYGEPLAFRRAKDLRRNAEVGVWYISWISKTLKKEGGYSKAGVIYCFNAGIGAFRERGYQVPKSHSNRIYSRYYKTYHAQLTSAKKRSP